MRKIREVLRLYFAAALSIRAIARSLGTSPSTVGEYLRRAKVAGLSWPVPESVDDTGLERRLFPAPPSSRAQRPLPAWSEVHRELRRKSVTLSLLWQEYKETHPEGLQYSWFCEQVPGLGRAARPGDAPGAPRRREAIRRLRRADGAGGRPRDRRGAAGADLRGRARGLELHLRRGDVDADPAGLDGVARAGLRVLRRVSRAGGPRQPALRGQPRPPLRAGPESDLSRPRPHYGVAVLPARVRRRCDAPGTKRRRRWPFKWSSGGYSPPSVTARSSRWSSSTPRSPSCSNGSTPGGSASSRGRGARSSSSSTGRPCARCPTAPTSSPSGRPCGRQPTTTSRSAGTTTRSRTRSSAANSTSG